MCNSVGDEKAGFSAMIFLQSIIRNFIVAFRMSSLSSGCLG